jgi:secondary thiamine-phosphate synthase enzyme
MHQKMFELGVSTRGPGCYEVTAPIARWLTEAQCGSGLLTVFVRHTSASLTIQENADRDVQPDLIDALDRLAPQGNHYRHSCEGPDDMPAHIKSAITSTCLTIPVMHGAMTLGTWQGIYLLEHRDRPHQRKLVLHFLGQSI